MRQAVAVLAVCLGGCSLISPAPQTRATAGLDRGCTAVAAGRAADAAYNGFSDEDQRLIYQGTYADCLRWRQKHRAD